MHTASTTSTTTTSSPSVPNDDLRILDEALESLYRDQIRPATSEVVRRLQERHAPAYHVNNLVFICTALDRYEVSRVGGATANKGSKSPSALSASPQQQPGQSGTYIYLAGREGSWVDPKDPSNLYAAEVWRAFLAEIRRPMQHGQGGKRPEGHNLGYHQFKGGRYGMAAEFKQTATGVLKELSLGQLCHMIQLAISYGFLAYENSLLQPSSACHNLTKAALADFKPRTKTPAKHHPSPSPLPSPSPSPSPCPSPSPFRLSVVPPASPDPFTLITTTTTRPSSPTPSTQMAGPVLLGRLSPSIDGARSPTASSCMSPRSPTVSVSERVPVCAGKSMGLARMWCDRLVKVLDERQNGIVLAQLKKRLLERFRAMLQPTTFGFTKLSQVLTAEPFFSSVRLYEDRHGRLILQSKRFDAPRAAKILLPSQTGVEPMSPLPSLSSKAWGDEEDCWAVGGVSSDGGEPWTPVTPVSTHHHAVGAGEGAVELLQRVWDQQDTLPTSFLHWLHHPCPCPYSTITHSQHTATIWSPPSLSPSPPSPRVRPSPSRMDTPLADLEVEGPQMARRASLAESYRGLKIDTGRGLVGGGGASVSAAGSAGVGEQCEGTPWGPTLLGRVMHHRSKGDDVTDGFAALQ
ncbi:unnamed protein product [Vitrella brassicaformis CCMP3155]|uniref:HTH OST-type domain-containing protein n=1 Tax=Vitrella brassicaformis (strain CCMP3155) TaxID=1169540 RepID=A0A0G4H1R7_VITBC|nr:unnamed protein product [Vitrella brassicaformis CCMP3155]|eukprot:CEM37588.1 unnamed protein product [Vitrella brassicaformis CCMP3155]